MRTLFIIFFLYFISTGCKSSPESSNQMSAQKDSYGLRGKIDSLYALMEPYNASYWDKVSNGELKIIQDSLNPNAITVKLSGQKTHEFADSFSSVTSLENHYIKRYVRHILGIYPEDMAFEYIKFLLSDPSAFKTERIIIRIDYGIVCIFSNRYRENLALLYDILVALNNQPTIGIDSYNMRIFQSDSINGYLDRGFTISLRPVVIERSLERYNIDIETMTLDDLKRWLDAPSEDSKKSQS